MKIKISNNKQKQLQKGVLETFPKYTTFIINQASQTAQATRPDIVGQLSEEFPLYVEECKQQGIEPSLQGWVDYHTNKFFDAIDLAKEKIKNMIENFRIAIDKIDDGLIEVWVKDLLYTKTYLGLNTEALIKEYIRSKGLIVVKSSPEEESRNIDLYINKRPYQIKPQSYSRTGASTGHQGLPPVIFYKKSDENIELEIDDPQLLNLLK
jgi:hypothetical protein